MRVRNPADKKRRLLDAALVEFGEFGLAGARVDALASRAQCSSGLVYTYFGNKEGLFEAVLADIAEQTRGQVPITPEDLPGYAARLYDMHAENPDIERFVAWYQLEHRARDGSERTTDAVAQDKIERIAAAQRAGILPDRLTAAEIVLAVQTIARSWFTLPYETLAALEPSGSHETRREIVRRTVAALISTTG